MKYSGTIIKESLKDLSVLDEVEIKNEEVLQPGQVMHFQPKEWTAIYFENDDGKLDLIIEKLRPALKDRWYIIITSEKRIHIVFSKKSFSYEKEDLEKRKIIREYAIRAGVPKSQINFPE